MEEIKKINDQVKKFVVYSEEIDLEQTRPIRRTEYYEILSLPEKNSNGSEKKDKPESKNKKDALNKGKTISLNDYNSRRSDKIDDKKDVSSEEKKDDDLFDLAITGNFEESNKHDGQELK